jgi:predicted nucleotidyltransferase
MRVHYDAPKDYRYDMPMFDKENKVTERVRTGLENVLSAYADISHSQSKITDNNPKNYKVEKAYIVGSGARINKVDSDMDLMLIAPNLDESSANQMKMVLSFIYFSDRPKQEGIDVFVRKMDKYPERANIEITDQVKGIINKYNKKL